MTSGGDDRREPKFPEREAYKISDLEQLKVLADPLRIRILEGFCRERTTKQVAELIREKPTKLYHHVEALERVGLIELSRTRQNRGTLEKYYLAVARTFQADSRVFSRADESAESGELQALKTMASTIFESTASEMHRLLDSGKAAEGLEEQGILSYIEILAPEKELREVRARLAELLESIKELDEGQADGAEDLERYRLTIAYFPMEPSEQA